MLKCLWEGKALTRAAQPRTAPTSMLRQESSHPGLGQAAQAQPARTSARPSLAAAKGKALPGQERTQCQGRPRQHSGQRRQWAGNQGTFARGEVKYQVKASMAARTRILPNKEDRRAPLCHGHVRISC